MNTVQSLLRHLATRPVIRAARAVTTAALDVCRQSLAFTLSMMLIVGQPFFLTTRAHAQTADPTPPPAPTYSPTLKTDKLDYSPTTTVQLTGAGFAANETVTLQVVHIVGDNDPDPGDLPWTVQTDANGNFATTWYVPWDAFLDTMLATAYGNVSQTLASATFTDGETFEGWTNTAGQWSHSNANNQNSHWAESDTVPFRVIFAAQPGSTHTVLIKYDFTLSPTSSVHFMDGIVQYDRTASPDLTSGYTVGPATTYQIPQDPLTNVPQLSNAQRGNFYVYNASVTATGTWSTVSDTNGLIRVLPVTIVVPADNQNPNTAKTVILGYGLHLASPDFWHAGNGAASFNGGSGKAYENTDGSKTDGQFQLNTGAIVAATPQQIVNFAGNSKVYSANNTFTLNGSATPSGLPVAYTLDTSAATGAGVNATLVGNLLTIPGVGGNVKVTATQGGGTSGNVTYAAATPVVGFFSITPAPITVTADAKSKVYGQSDPALTYQITSGSLVGTDTFTGALTRDAGESVGAYPIKQGTLALSSNYTLTYVGANLTITTLAISVAADPKTKVYGGSEPALTYHITNGSLVGTDAFTGALSRTSGEDVGTYAINQGTLALSSNYALTYVGANLTITAKPITVTADPKTKVYGGSEPALTYHITSGSLVGTDAFTGALSRTSGEDVGTYAINQGTLALSSNYALTYVGANLTITAKPITVTADAKSKVYGGSEPALTYQITSGGLVGTDSFTGALTRVSGEDVGTYAINQGTLALSSNYALTYVGANLSITAKPITVTADAKSKVYGGSEPALTYQITSGSLVGTDSFTGALTRVSGEDVGTYAINQGTLALSSNYNLSYTGANLTISARPISVTADAKSKGYGDADPALTYQITSGSLVGSDAFSGGLTRVTGEDVGAYAITQGTLALSSNYNLSYTGANLTISARPISVTADAKSKGYGDADPALTYQITSGSLVGSDAFSGGLTRVTGEDVGAYAITQGTLALSSNYNLSYTGANLTITAKPIKVTADAKTKVFGDADPALTYQITSGSLVGSDAFSGALTRDSGENAGTYAITQGTLALSSNYTLTYVGANLTITQATATGILSGETDQGINKGTSNILVNQTSFAGQAVTLHADVSGVTGAASPTGTVKFYQFLVQAEFDAYNALTTNAARVAYKAARVGTIDFGTGTITPSTATIIDLSTSASGPSTLNPLNATTRRADLGPLNYPILAVGHHLLSFDYSGDTNYASFDPTMDWGVVQVPTSTGVVASADPTFGTAITFTATVTSQQPTYANFGSAAYPGHVFVEGTVTFKDVLRDGLGNVISTTVIGSSPISAAGHGQTDGTLVVSIQYSLPAGGHHTITAEFFDGNPTDPTPGAYGKSSSEVTPIVAAKKITVKADHKTKVYGDTDPSLTYQITSGSLVGTDSFTGALTRDPGNDVGSYNITQGTLALSSNYDLTYVSDTLTITAKPITVKADPQTKVYGTVADPTLTYSITVGGPLLSGDSFSGALTRAPGETVGSYAISQGSLTAGSNYNITYIGANLTITAKPITVKADPQTKVYGTVADPALTYSITVGGPLVSGDSFSGALTRAPGETVGSYAISQGSLTAGSNYNITYIGADLTITAKPITVKADPQTKVYGTVADPALTYSITVGGPLVSGDSFSGALSRAPGETVGTYAISQNTLTAGSNYNITYIGANLTITAKPITVKADPQTKVYGTVADPALTYSITVGGPLVSGDSFSGALSRASGETVGTYAISQNTLTAGSNYNITYIGANLTITAKPITVKADPQTKVYGTVADPALTYSITVGGPLVSGDSFSGALSRASGETVGTYAISQNTLTAGSNYNITYIGADLTITAKPITVKADPQTKVYGTVADPALTYSITVGGPLVSGDSFSGALSRAPGETVGTYAISQNTLTAGSNYNITYIGANLTITAKPITVKADPQTKVYGTVADPALTYSITVGGPLVSGDSFSGALSRASGETVGTYAISQNTLTAGSNYNITYIGANLTITAKALDITAVNLPNKPYGTQITPAGTEFTVGTGQLVAGDGVTSVTLASGGYSATAAPATYSIVPSAAAGTGLTNYAITYHNGSVTVVQATISGKLNGVTNTGENLGVNSAGTATSLTSVAGQAVVLRADVYGSNGIIAAAPAGGVGKVIFYQFTDVSYYNDYKAAILANDQATAHAIKTNPAKATNLNTAFSLTLTYTSAVVTVAGVPTNTGQWSTPALNYPNLQVGTHLLAFEYLGDTNYNPFDPDMPWGIQAVPTTTGVSANGTPTYSAAGVTFTALVNSTLPTYAHFGSTGTGDAHTFVEGQVAFYIDGAASPFSTILLTGQNTGVGKAVSDPIVLTAGSHSVVAVYSDPVTPSNPYAYTGSTSTTTNFTVAKGPSVTTIIMDAGGPEYYDCTPHGADHATVTGYNLNIDPYVLASYSIVYTGTSNPNTPAAAPYGPTSVKPTLIGTYTAKSTYLGDDNHTGSSDTENFTIKGYAGAGPAGSLYTGALLFWTTGPSSSTASLALSCTVADIGKCHGDIRGATVTFQVSNDGTNFKDVPNAANLKVGLADPTKIDVGTASALAQWNMQPNTDVDSFVLKIVVGGNYTASTHIYTITVAKPGLTSQFVGGNSISNGAVAGFPASSGYLGVNALTDADSNTTVSATVKYNNKLTNPQGKVTVTFTTYNKADGTNDYPNIHTYIATSNAISELSQNPSKLGNLYSFSSKVTLKEIVGNGTTGVDSGNMMNITLIPGTTGPTGTNPDRMGIQIQRSQSMGGGLWFSTSWGSASPGALPSTLNKPIAGGDIVTF